MSTLNKINKALGTNYTIEDLCEIFSEIPDGVTASEFIDIVGENAIFIDSLVIENAVRCAETNNIIVDDLSIEDIKDIRNRFMIAGAYIDENNHFVYNSNIAELLNEYINKINGEI